MRLISLAFVAIFAAVILTGCKSRPSTAPQRASLVGVWENREGSQLTIYNNGVFTLKTSVAVAEPVQLRGRLQRGANRLVVSYDAISGLCPGNTGLYTFLQKEDTLQIQAVDEGCAERQQQLASAWRHVARLPNVPIPVR